MIPFVAVYISFRPKVILNSFFVPTPVGDPVIAKRVYRGGAVSVCSKRALVDLFDSDMVDFNVILGIDWLHSCYASLDYRTSKVVFRLPGELDIESEDGFVP